MFKLFSNTKKEIKIVESAPEFVIKDQRKFEYDKREQEERFLKCQQVAVDIKWLKTQKKLINSECGRGKLITNTYTKDELQDMERRANKGRPPSFGTRERMAERRKISKMHKRRINLFYCSMASLQFVDRLVVDYLEHSTNIIPSEISKVTKLIDNGEISDAIQLINQSFPTFMQTFSPIAEKLKRQEYIESIRNSTSVEKSLQVLKEYSNTKQEVDKDSVLMLFYRESTGTDSPVSVDMEFDKRAELSTVVKKYLHAFTRRTDPSLCLIIRYLGLNLNMYIALHGLECPVPLINDIILPDRQDQIIFSDSLPDHPVSMPEIHQLCQIVSISPEEAERALNAKNGSFEKALISELMRIDLNESILKEIVLEYCSYRGITSPDQQLCASPTMRVIKRGRDEKLIEYSRDQLLQLQHIQNEIKTCINNWATVAGNGHVAQLISQIELISPHFFKEQPYLDFMFKRWQFLDLIGKTGQVTPEAIKLIQTDLALLAERNQNLKPLFIDLSKHIMFPPLLSDFDKYMTDSFATEVYSTLALSLGISEPRLLTTLRKLLEYHDIYFKERSEVDKFEDLFELKNLREITNTKSETNQVSDTSATFFNSEEVLKAEADADEAGLKKEDIDAVIDILACSRLEAINLLLQHNGDLNEALSIIFG